MFNKVDYVMVNVSEMGRSVAFYRDTLGLLLKFESPGWSEFQTGATTLALHTVVPRSAEAADGLGRLPEPVRLAFRSRGSMRRTQSSRRGEHVS